MYKHSLNIQEKEMALHRLEDELKKQATRIMEDKQALRKEKFAFLKERVSYLQVHIYMYASTYILYIQYIHLHQCQCSVDIYIRIYRVHNTVIHMLLLLLTGNV